MSKRFCPELLVVVQLLRISDHPGLGVEGQQSLLPSGNAVGLVPANFALCDLGENLHGFSVNRR